MALHAYWGRADEGSSPGFTLLSEVGAWLETLPDVEGNAELRRIQEAVQALEKPTQQSVFPICAAWQQAEKRNGKNLTVDVVVEELTEKVLAASNAAQRRVERSSGAAQPAASSGAAQPAYDDELSRNFTSLREVGGGWRCCRMWCGMPSRRRSRML